VTATLTPVPDKDAVWGLAPSPPLYETLSVLEREPAAVGLNFAVMVQDAPIASEPPAALHDPAPVLVSEKSPEFPPTIDGVMDVAVVELLFVSVKVTDELDDPTLTEPKFSVEGERITAVLATN